MVLGLEGKETVKFSDYVLDYVEDCKDIKIILGRLVGNIPRGLRLAQRTWDWTIRLRRMWARLAQPNY